MTYSLIGVDTTTGNPVYLYQKYRIEGLTVVGLQRMGKSGLFEELILSDIKQGIGVCVLDPHGELVDHIIARLPGKTEEERKAQEERVILLDLTVKDYFFGLNLFDCADPTDDDEIEKTLSQVLHVFEKAYGIIPTTPLMYNLLYKSAYTLIANPGSTMIDIHLLLTSEPCRKKLAQAVFRRDIRDFWDMWDDPRRKSPQDQQKDSETILNKLNNFLGSPLRYIIGQSQSTINLQKIMDEGKILLVKLDRRREQATSLIGSILVALLLNASDTRNSKKPFHLYADEFENFATEDFAVLLEQAGKRNISVAMAFQNLSQLELSDKQADKNLKNRTLSVGSLIVFRSPTNAHELAGQFDTSPQPARVEVLEEESVQVLKEEEIEILKPEWHEPKVDIIEDGQEEIQETRTDVVEWALHSPNPFLNEFFKPWQEIIQAAHMHINEGETPDTTYGRGRHSFTHFGKSWSNRDRVEEAKKRLDTMNTLLYRAMATKTFQVLPIPLLRWMGNGFIFQTTGVIENKIMGDIYVPVEGVDYQCFLGEFSRNTVIPPSREGIAAYERLWTVPDNQLSDAFRAYECIARSLLGNYLKVFWDDYISSNPYFNEESLRILNTRTFVCSDPRKLDRRYFNEYTVSEGRFLWASTSITTPS